MEKVVSANKGNPCAGLLSARGLHLRALPAACALFFCAASLFAVETEMRMTDPPFAVNEAFALSFLFYGAAPDAVFFEGEEAAGNGANSFYYIEESFPPSFAVESIRKSLGAPTRQGVFAGSRARATLVEVEAMPREAGSFDIGPFVFRVGDERVTFPTVRILVEGPDSPAEKSGEAFKLFWLIHSEPAGGLTSPAEVSDIEAGQGALIVLMAPLQADGNVTCPAPENALLEEASVDHLEIEGMLPGEMAGECAPVAAYIWTPLFEGRQALPRAAFSPISGGAVSFAQEELVEVAAARTAENVQDAQGESAPALQPPPPPKKPAELLALAADTRFEANLANAASALWDAGEFAKAAAMLRSSENVFPFSRRIAQMRGAVADALGTEGRSCGAGERALFFAPFALIAVSFILFASFILCSLVSRKRGDVRKSFFGGKKLIAACIILAALGAAGAIYSLAVGMEEAAGTGGFLLRVPDEAAAAVVALKDGAPLKIERRAQPWLYVKTADGTAGWYPSCKIIVYKSGSLREFWRHSPIKDEGRAQGI